MINSRGAILTAGGEVPLRRALSARSLTSLGEKNDISERMYCSCIHRLYLAGSGITTQSKYRPESPRGAFCVIAPFAIAVWRRNLCIRSGMVRLMKPIFGPLFFFIGFVVPFLLPSGEELVVNSVATMNVTSTGSIAETLQILPIALLVAVISGAIGTAFDAFIAHVSG